MRLLWKLGGGGVSIRPLNETDGIDLFPRNSEYFHALIVFKAESIYPIITPGGLLLSDDVSWNSLVH